MKKSYFLLFIVSFVTSLNAQIITFSDPVFKAKLLESSLGNFIARDLNGDYFAIDANSNGEIEAAEALQVGFLQIENSSISSLNEINNFTGLVSLNCENNLLATLNVSSLINLTVLDCSNNILTNLTVNNITALQNLNCQFNQLTNLDVSGISNLININCSYNQIVNLNLSNLLNLEILNCNDNVITNFDLSDLISLKTFDCSNNQLASINSSNLVSLETLNCNSNVINSLVISNLINFRELNCSNNQLVNLNLDNLSSLTDLNCNFNQLPSINLNGLIGLKNFSCTNNQLISLNLTGLIQLLDLNCSNNLIATIDLIGLNQLLSITCNSNQIVSLDVSSLANLKYLYCNNNSIITLNVNGLNALLVLSCSNNQITTLTVSNTNNLQSLYCSDNQISTLNLSNLLNFQNLYCYNNSLISLFIKNGSFENNLLLSGNPTLEFICADEFQIEFIQDEINNNNYTNCHVNSYCSFVPGGFSNSVQGIVKLDNNINGCDAQDIIYPNLKLSFSDGSISENIFANDSGNFSKSLLNGSYMITPTLENSSYFSISPSTVMVEFPFQASPFVQNFCLTPNGTHTDLEIALVPLNNAIPNIESTYKIVYKNKGTIAQSGNIIFNFDDAVLNLVASNPGTSSQSTNNLNWTFLNLNPLEIRSIFVTLKANSSTDTPPVNIGQLLPFNATVTTIGADENPNDNTITFIQEVTGTTTTNDKVCLEGSSVSSSQVGEYVHYCIRFKNSGNAISQNVVVKDIIDVNKYDIGSLILLDGSHSFETRVTNSNTVEFIFENINLDFNIANNDGYVLFKIKTLPTLSNGDTFSNIASIYYDYNAPISTNIESTIIQILANHTFVSSENFSVYPNPVKEVLNIYSSDVRTVDTISIYNSLGQLMKHILNPSNLSFNVSGLSQGIYFISILSENIKTSIKFIKE